MSSNIALNPGSETDYGERRFTIMQVICFETVVARDVETGDLGRLPIAGWACERSCVGGPTGADA
jgi:hypothetical protein